MRGRCAKIGVQTASKAAPNEPVALRSPDQAAGLFGDGSELCLMADTAFATGALFGQMPKLYAVPLAAPTGDVAQTQLAFTGTVTTAGRVLVRIAGVPVDVAVSAGDTAAELAQALRDAIGAKPRRLPVKAAGTGGTVLVNHKTSGVNGNDVAIHVVELPAGIDVNIPAPTPGTGNAAIATALDNLLALDVNGIALANHRVADVEAGSDHAAEAWQPRRLRWRTLFYGTTGDNSTAGALAVIDRHWITVGACKGSPSLPGQIAAALAVIAFATGSPNYNLAGYDRLPLHAPRPNDRYTPLEVEELLQLGAVALTAVPSRGDRLAISRMVTTHKTLSDAPTLQLKDLSVSLTSAYMARQLDAAYRRAFGPDSGSPRTLTPELLEQIRDVIVATLRSGEKAGYIRGVDARLGELEVVESEAVPGRVLAGVPIAPTPQLLQMAFDVNVYS